MDVLIENGLILTMDENRRVVEGSISIEGNEIEGVGNVGDKDAEKIIDAQDKIVMPGLVCACTHPYRTLLRSPFFRADSPSDFIQILQRVWWPFSEHLTDEDVYTSTLATCMEFIRSGTTFFAASHSAQGSVSKSLDSLEKAIEKAGLRAFIGFEASERKTRAAGARGMKENIRFLERRKKESSNNFRVNGMVCIEAPFTASDELLRHGKRVSSRFDVPLMISASEGKVDLYHNLERHEKRTIERLRDLGFLSSRTILSNCGNVNDDEMSIISRNDASIAHNPISNMQHAVETPDISQIKGKDIAVGLGNGGFVFDGFENMNILYNIHKFAAKNPSVISPEDALETATIGGAELFGLEDRIGSLESGKRADLIIIDTSDLFTPINRKNIFGQIINNVRGKDVETVMVGGDLVMENRNIKTLDTKRTRRKTKDTAKKLWKKIQI